MRKLLLSAISFFMLCQQAAADNITVDNTQRNYIVYAPTNLGDNRPLLISCHGMNQDAAYQKGQLQIESVADTAKFVTVFPNGIDKGWDISGNRDINFVKALIDEMVTRYNIDRKRVYLSGFSMGGMFTYHAMNKIPDLIAAFAPISGYPMGGTTANSNVRPLPIIHTHGTGDDVVNFGGVQGALNAWINHNGCPTTAEVTQRYRGTNHITRRVWGPGNNGVEVVLMELKDKGHWVSNDVVKTGEEIWNFCKRYSLDLKDPTVKITSPKQSTLKFVTLGGKSEVPAITVTATASDPDGEVVKVSFYDGTELIKEVTEAPYTCTVEGLTKGEHIIRAVATDDEGRTGNNKVTVVIEEPASNYTMQGTFAGAGGCVPDGWATYDGSEARTGFASGFSSGSRVFEMTGATRDFDWGLYTRNVNGNVKAGFARYAAKGTNATLMLYPGNYTMLCRVSNWNCSNFSPVTMALETIDGETVYEGTFTPKANVGNAANSNFSGVTTERFSFDVTKKGQYVVTFYTADAAWADLIIGAAAIRRLGDVTGVEAPTAQNTGEQTYYNMAGQRVQPSGRGVYVQQTKQADGKVSSRVVMKQ